VNSLVEIRDYINSDEKEWVYTKALSYLFSPFFDDISKTKDTLHFRIQKPASA